ncbi:hypothetical protein HCU64_04330 [Methylobacterium sp. C25]|uniref:hypothetical protein n=1 Tax=Methylobacterium sp. C25 TaxID=2721622 RepID=UPI001F2867C4|nr:hypothetical protein [Methylobacterium sp. C25]MCE4222969.1 hypothetical protein [Methylobacterium sp. C25]
MSGVRFDRTLPVIAGLLLAITWPVTARATIKEYQIRRMLLLKTECGTSGLEISEKDGKDRFFATCENVAHYPDGVEILCPDSEDERDCTMVTEKREFRHLHHMRPVEQDEHRREHP